MSTTETSSTSKRKSSSGETATLEPTQEKTSSAIAKGTRSTELALHAYEPGPLPNNRPITPSHLRIASVDHLPGGRPVFCSDLEIVQFGTIYNNRPVFASTLEVVDSSTLPNHRPISVSKLEIAALDSLPNHRPIMVDQYEDHQDLMGFID